MLLLGVIPIKAQDYQKCVLIETVLGEKLEYYISSNPRLTQDNDKVTLSSDVATLEFSTTNIKKVYLSEGNYKVVYMLDGNVYKTYYHHAGVNIVSEPTPKKEGYIFSGWGNEPTIMPANDVTVTGNFTLESYKLIYMVDNDVYKAIDVAYGTSITPIDSPTKEGCTFSGWSEIPSTMPAHDVIVTGAFTIGQYKLTYVIDGETYKVYSLNYDTAIIPETEPVKEGYTFSGWSWLPSKMPANDVTVTGSFTINKYSIIYIIDNSIFKNDKLEYGAKVTPPSAPVRDGYDFAWNNHPETMPAEDVIVIGTYSPITGISNVSSRQGTNNAGDYIHLSGLQPNETVSVCNLAGKILQSHQANSDGELTITFSTLGKGVYIIKSNRQTFKVTRK